MHPAIVLVCYEHEAERSEVIRRLRGDGLVAGVPVLGRTPHVNCNAP